MERHDTTIYGSVCSSKSGDDVSNDALRYSPPKEPKQRCGLSKFLEMSFAAGIFNVFQNYPMLSINICLSISYMLSIYYVIYMGGV